MTSRSQTDTAEYWWAQFHTAFSALSWAVGKLGDEAGYAGVVHARLLEPQIGWGPNHPDYDEMGQ